MGKIVVSENVSLDGVTQDPTGEEGFRHGGWFGRTGDKDRDAWAKMELDEALGAEALLLGRRSDEWFAARWLSKSDAWADRLNGLPKYVVSSTLEEPRWASATVLTGDVADEVLERLGESGAAGPAQGVEQLVGGPPGVQGTSHRRGREPVHRCATA